MIEFRAYPGHSSERAVLSQVGVVKQSQGLLAVPATH